MQFPLGEVAEYAGRSAYADDQQVLAIGAAARDRGLFAREEFLIVCAWRTRRSKRLTEIKPPRRCRQPHAADGSGRHRGAGDQRAANPDGRRCPHGVGFPYLTDTDTGPTRSTTSSDRASTSHSSAIARRASKRSDALAPGARIDQRAPRPVWSRREDIAKRSQTVCSIIVLWRARNNRLVRHKGPAIAGLSRSRGDRI